MDILNWIYLVKNKLRKTTIQNPDKDLVILGGQVGFSKRGDGYQSYGMHVSDFANSLMSGTDYIIVRAQGTPEENAQEFLAAYAKASNADRDSDNRFSLLLAPGHYKFQETFLHNQSNINIVSLTGEQDVVFDLELNGRDPFSSTRYAYMYNLTIDADVTYSDSLLNGQPAFLEVNGGSSVNYGFDSSGMYFYGDADTNGYPIYTTNVIPQNQTTKVTFTFTHTYDCDDQGVCVFLDGDVPNWNWDPDSTRIAAQYDCPQPTIYGLTNSFEGPTILEIGETYIAEFTYNPTAGTSTLVTKSLAGVILNTIVLNEVLGAGDYRVGFSADNDDWNFLLTSPVMNIEKDAYDSTVSGIVTMYYKSSNYNSWSGYGTDYNLPLNLISDVSGLVVKNCTAGPFSFGANVNDSNFNIYATFENCTAYGAYSFGYNINYILGTFTNCSGEHECFVATSAIFGSFTNCKAGTESLRANGLLYGQFIGCQAANDSFNGGAGIQANFTNCTGTENCFKAYNGDVGGDFINCEATTSSFRADNGNMDAFFISCRADSGFSASSINNGDYYYCVLYNDTFSGGTQEYCISI